jgi:16S rRNA (adenine1518-N6/adenine1519-N6)-dimethyltransferase
MKHQARKRFGQNFLTDQSLIEQIIEFIHPASTDHMLEIGPGLGALTSHLVPNVAQLTAVEIDRDLIEHLEKTFSRYEHFSVINKDVLKFDLSELEGEHRVVGNLPYNISTPLLFHLFNYADQIIDLHIMLQKEVVDRIKAQPATSDYGRLSVMTQYHCEIGHDFLVPAAAFDPKPKVDSAFMRLKPYKEKPYVAKDYTLFANIVRDAFNMRRKQLKNSLSKYITAAQLQDLDIDCGKRPEAVTLEEYVSIANQIYDETKE